MAPTTQVQEQKFDSSYVIGKPLKCNPVLTENKVSIRGTVAQLLKKTNPGKQLISLGVGDAAAYPCFRKGHEFASRIIADVGASAEFDCYAPCYGFPATRRVQFPEQKVTVPATEEISGSRLSGVPGLGDQRSLICKTEFSFKDSIFSLRQ